MIKIRLTRTGKNTQPNFRLVIQEQKMAVKGKFIEAIGYYRPAMDPKEFKADLERVKYWLSVGAQPSDTVAVLLKREGVEGMEKFIEPRTHKRKSKKAPAEEPVKPAAAPAPAAEAAPEPAAEATPEPVAEATPEPVAEATPEPAAEAAPEPAAEESSEKPA